MKVPNGSPYLFVPNVLAERRKKTVWYDLTDPPTKVNVNSSAARCVPATTCTYITAGRRLGTERTGLCLVVCGVACAFGAAAEDIANLCVVYFVASNWDCDLRTLDAKRQLQREVNEHIHLTLTLAAECGGDMCSKLWLCDVRSKIDRAGLNASPLLGFKPPVGYPRQCLEANVGFGWHFI